MKVVGPIMSALGPKVLRCSTRQALAAVGITLVCVFSVIMLNGPRYNDVMSVIEACRHSKWSTDNFTDHSDQDDSILRLLPQELLKKPIVHLTECNVGAIMRDFSKFPHLQTVQENLETCSSIFYNRVPKCASRTVLTSFKWLAQKQNFTFVSAARGMTQNFFNNSLDLAWFVREFVTLQEPLVYSRHLHYVNFSQYGYPKPVYINVIRDPVERLISHYYYHQSGSYSRPGPEGHHNVTSLDDCVQKSGRHCVRSYLNKVIPFFCGHIKSCLSKKQFSLKRAKQVARDSYMVVGVTEDLHGFMEVLEALMPRFFTNASYAFHRVEDLGQRKYRTIYKPAVSPATRASLKDILAEEYEFYNFIQIRFTNLLERVRKAKDFAATGDQW